MSRNDVYVIIIYTCHSTDLSDRGGVSISPGPAPSGIDERGLLVVTPPVYECVKDVGPSLMKSIV